MRKSLGRPLLVLCLLACIDVTFAEGTYWQVEAGYGHIDVAPTLLDRLPIALHSEREIPDIRTGNRAWLGLRWQGRGPWYVTGRYERLNLTYHNPLTLNCPFYVVMRFPNVDGACTAHGALFSRDGFIDDKVDHGRIAVGYTRTLSDWLDGFVELGYGRMRWDSDDDLEATAATGCQTFQITPDGNFYGTRVDVPGCQRISRKASADGLVASLGLNFDLPAGFGLDVSWRHQGYRHVIYRNQILPEFNEVNAESCGGFCTRPTLYLDQPQGSWNWFQARLGYDFNDHFGVFVEAETGGSRDWNVYSGGLRFAF